MTNALNDTDYCTTCKNNGTVTCDHVGTGRDEDGWCTTCDVPADEPGWITCPGCENW
jgi:hypothetical protein